MLSKRIQRIIKMRQKDKKPTKNSKELTCYNYGKIGHFKSDYFKKKKDEKTREKEAVKGKKKRFYKGKKPMAVVWTDEDASSSSRESEVEEQIGLMADHEVTSPPSTSHSFISNFRHTEDDELSHEELVEALSQVCCKLKSVSKEKKVLEKSLESLLSQKENLQKDFSKVISEKKSLEEKLKKMIKRSSP